MSASGPSCPLVTKTRSVYDETSMALVVISIERIKHVLRFDINGTFVLVITID